VSLAEPLGRQAAPVPVSPPVFGPGQLRLRGSDPKVYGTDREHALRVAAEGWYKTLAADFSRQQICVNVYSCPSQGAAATLASIGAYSTVLYIIMYKTLIQYSSMLYITLYP